MLETAVAHLTPNITTKERVSVQLFSTEQSGDKSMKSQESVRKVLEFSRDGGHKVALVMES